MARVLILRPGRARSRNDLHSLKCVHRERNYSNICRTESAGARPQRVNFRDQKSSKKLSLNER